MAQLKYKLLNDLGVAAEEAYKTLRTNIRFATLLIKLRQLR